MTSFIVGLCHFCEVHGPSTIICTQEADNETDHLLQTTSKLQTCSSCKLIVPQEGINLVSKKLLQHFVSTQYPANQKRYTSLTKLVMKVLSVETNSDVTKPLFIGDNHNGYCLHKIFKIKDINARGGERKYGLLVICDKELGIMNNYHLISNYLSLMITCIQTKVDNVIETNLKRAQKTCFNDNERYLRKSFIKPRSLVELTGDDQVFVKLHVWALEMISDLKR